SRCALRPRIGGRTGDPPTLHTLSVCHARAPAKAGALRRPVRHFRPTLRPSPEHAPADAPPFAHCPASFACYSRPDRRAGGRMRKIVVLAALLLALPAAKPVPPEDVQGDGAAQLTGQAWRERGVPICVARL